MGIFRKEPKSWTGDKAAYQRNQAVNALQNKVAIQKSNGKSSAKTQNDLADFYRKHGYTDIANAIAADAKHNGNGK